MIVLAARNFMPTAGRRFASNFISALVAEASKAIDENLTIISCDDMWWGPHVDNYCGARVFRVRSTFQVDSLASYNETWRNSLRKTLLSRNLDFMRVLTEAAKIPDLRRIHWFDFFTPLLSLADLVPRMKRGIHAASLFALSRSHWGMDKELLSWFSLGLDALVVNTGCLGNYLTTFLKSVSIRNIPVGVDLSVFRPGVNKPRLKQRRGIAPRRKVISWFGPISPSEPRDVLRMLESVRSVRVDPQPLFVFAFKYGVPADISQNIPNVRLVSGLKNAQELLAISDAIVLPFSQSRSWVSYQPLTIIEALASGVPVITMNYPGIDEAVISGSDGLLLNDAKDLIQAASDLCRDEIRLDEMSTNARIHAMKRFDIRTTVRSYIDFWQE